MIRRTMRHFWDRVFSDMTIVMFIYYPITIEYILEMANCKKVGDLNLIFREMNSICFQKVHLSLFLCLTLPCFIIWIVVVPFWIIKKLR